MRIGICGGTFDPFHRGHLHPVLAAREAMEWDRILYIPAYRQPFKTHRVTSSGYDRFAMTILGTEDHDDVYVSARELERGAISYTVDTLEELHAEYRDATFEWVIGDDNLAELHAWRSLDRIFALANFAVLTRGEKRLSGDLRARVTDADGRPPHGAIVFAHNPTVPVSATEIRRRVRDGESIDDLVDPRVSRYIHHYRLYKEDDK